MKRVRCLQFASRPIKVIVSNYHTPNNHVFHSLLVHFSYLLFGNHPWALRLPVLIAGVFVVPLSYLLIRMLYDRRSAILTAALVSWSAPMIEYSTYARGYAYLVTFTLLAFSLAFSLMQKCNAAAWVLMAFCSTLGFFTIPVMLYPFAILVFWILLCQSSNPTCGTSMTLRRIAKFIVVVAVSTAFCILQ